MASNPWARRDRGHCVSYRRRSGVAFRGGNLADYFVKLAREITSSTTKNSRAGRSPFAVLRDGLTTGFLDDLELWRDWEQVSKGRRQVTWSLGDHDLRTLAGLDPEQSDEEIAAEEVLHGDDALALPHETWTALRRTGQTTDLLDVTETGGYEGAVFWLGERGLDWLYASTAA